MYYIYILKSLKTKMLYIGMTNNLRKRLEKHNSGSENFTKKYIPWELVYFEGYKDQKDAILRERRLKNYGASLGQLKKRIANSLK